METATLDPLPTAFYDSRMLDSKQAMELLGVKKITLNKMIHRKDDALPSYKIGRLRKFKLDQLLWWIEKHAE